MSTRAQAILEEIRALPPREQWIVREQVVSLTQDRQREALNRLRGASRGKGLLAKLLADRAKERARG
jgi:hypothetical protein